MTGGNFPRGPYMDLRGLRQGRECPKPHRASRKRSLHEYGLPTGFIVIFVA
jgi:hypothetical protein